MLTAFLGFVFRSVFSTGSQIADFIILFLLISSGFGVIRFITTVPAGYPGDRRPPRKR
jgi:hypothetical protein